MSRVRHLDIWNRHNTQKNRYFSHYKINVCLSIFFLISNSEERNTAGDKEDIFWDSNAINYNSLSGIFNTNGIYIKMNCSRLYDKWSTCVFNAQLLSFSILFPIFLHLIICIKDNRFKSISPLTFFSKIVWRCHCMFIPSLTGSQTWQLLYVLNILK